MSLDKNIEKLFDSKELSEKDKKRALVAFKEMVKLLNNGKIRSAEKRNGKWQVNRWVKKGILLGFRIGKLKVMSIDDRFRFFDKHVLPLKPLKLNDNVRMVPGGSSIRSGCYIGKGVICMPPMYINIGAFVDENTLIDSNALVGSCAQLGKKIHLSAAAQIGGVLEPINSLPVIIEDEVMIGGNAGIYEGTIVQRRAVIAAGCIITGSTPVYDTVNGKIYRKTAEEPLIIPEGAVVVAGSRSLKSQYGIENNLSIYTPIIIKYRDEKTDVSTALEESLR
ncbi:MAG: 2,3,4,5-tetrahydropyridine-2,6-dicarboxylate N-succinyltransferase [Chlorobi bacterium]|nr:2,3,4,5-tetrahydropyridine-2,6-dicarboxylate N-succinyltransferase [Chlorobiota bacterium]MCI0714768.1 2,3,4,5-tetrahydropyridine-2,6-dicarboxylate N-succinyltransferase [Chlorobiota bacterium]